TTEECENMVLLATAPAAGGLLGFLPIILMLAVFYLVLIRPQMQQQKKRQEMLNSLRVGDKVITIGGIHGELTAVDDDEVRVRVADKVELRMNRSGIGHVKGKG